MTTPHFADALIARIRELGHPLCVGLDPHLAQIPEPFHSGSMRPADPATAEAVERFLCTAVDRLEGRVAAVKPQIAFFEQLGWPGLRALDAVLRHARERGLLVVLDAKRGDIGSTAAGYAGAYLEVGAPFAADALTVSPYLGGDSLDPMVTACERSGSGLFVLVKTSNPGSGQLQDRSLEGAPLFQAVAELLAPMAKRLLGKTGWSSLGAVVGATWPEQGERIREALPESLFLIPGYGAQGASADDAVRTFRPGPRGREGGLVNSARAILFPASRDWESGFDATLGKAIEELGAAVSR